MKALVSVIIVSYNTREYTVKAIKSVLNSEGFNTGEIEVIVVDNNSSDDTVAYINKNLPSVKIIANQTNLGFGGGNNLGAARGTGKYLLFLNSDAFLGPNSLKVMLEIMEQHPEIISVGPQLIAENGEIQQSAGYLPTPMRVDAWMWWLDKIPLIKNIFSTPYHIYDPSWYRLDGHPEWLMGACILFRKREFDSVQGFDDKIFMYAEEVELYLRLKKKYGKKVLFTTKTQVEHVGSVSTKKANAYRLVHELRGIEYIYAKHFPHLLWFIKLVINVGVFARILLFSLMPTRRDTLIEYKKYFG